VTRFVNAELLLGVVALVVAMVYFAAARAIPASMLDDVVGSGGVPTVYGIALALLALAQIARAALRLRRPPPSGHQAEGVSHRKTFVTLALGIAYATLLPWVGYAGSMVLLLAATAAYHGAALNRQLLLVSIGGAACLWVLFVWLLGIPQPAGIWASY
jgi:putative tricarboxylic transport membrane protein